MLKKILYGILAIYSFTNISNLFAIETHNEMLPGNGDGVTTDQLNVAKDGEKGVDKITAWVVDSIDFLLPITAVGVFLFVGIRLALARGNPEEFKKAWMQFMYAVIGIFAISFAWAAVKLISGLSI